ncbi:uncharacterized protein At4g04775-like [Eutrema salsugineum]|uniref:uncharacterized protein At4g04775-like n=1 Tax=Eutrema salsugineum TaxID=72664 RepID=UPI000CED1966|nr:uncharacterized protein At4g04775-like [Eutrema salsugineum]
MTGNTPATPGRRYYTCPFSFKEGSREHIWKWWDEAVTEELERLKIDLGNHKEKLQVLGRDQAFDPRFMRLENLFQSLERSMECNELVGDIREMKDEILRLQGDFVWMTEQNTRGDHYLMLALLFVFAAIAYMLSTSQFPYV